MIKGIICFFISLLIISCGKSINPEELLKNENLFKLTVHTINNDDSTYNSETDTIYKDSEKISRLKAWLIDNSSNWKNSIASYAMTDISLIGTDFSLLIYKDGVVLGFTDISGNHRQYTKSADESTFNFLIDKPSKDIGSGIHIYVYELIDSTEVWIGYADKILYATHLDKSHKIINSIIDGANLLTCDYFKNNLKSNMDFNSITSKFGVPSKDIGSGIHIYVYELIDSSEVWIGYTDKILYAKHMDINHVLLEDLIK